MISLAKSQVRIKAYPLLLILFIMPQSKKEQKQGDSSSPDTSSHPESEEEYALVPAPPKKQQTQQGGCHPDIQINLKTEPEGARADKLGKRKRKGLPTLSNDSSHSEEETIVKKQSKRKGAAPPELLGDSSPSSKSDNERSQQPEKAAPGLDEKPKSKRLYIGNLAYEVNEKMLRKSFKKYGSLKSVSLAINSTTGKSKGYAFVQFEHAECAENAKKQMSMCILFNRQIRVEFCDCNE